MPGEVRRRDALVGGGVVAEGAERAGGGRRAHHVRGVQAARRARAARAQHRGVRHVRPRVPRQVPLAARRRLDTRYCYITYLHTTMSCFAFARNLQRYYINDTEQKQVNYFLK